MRLLCMLIFGIAWASERPQPHSFETGESARVIFYSSAKVVKGRPLLLDDVGFVEGVAPEIASQMGATVIFSQVEFAGESATFSGAELGRAFRAKVQEIFSGSLRMTLPETIELEAAKTVLPEMRAENQIRYRLAQLCDECRITVRDLRIPIAPLEKSGLDWKIEFQDLRRTGSLLLPIKSEGSSSVLYLTATVMIEQEGFVVTRSLPVGQALDTASIEKRWIDVTRAKDALAKESDVKTMVLTRHLSLNSAVYLSDLRKVFAVKKGQALRALSGTDGLEVSRDVIAEENGYLGDLIRLRLPESKKIIMGRLVDSSKAGVLTSVEARVE